MNTVNSLRSNASRLTPRSGSADLGPALIRAVGSINAGTANATIDALGASLESTLRSKGVRDTGWVKAMLYQARGAHQGVPGDASRFKANVQKAQRQGVLGPNGAATLLQKVGAPADRQEAQSRVDNSILNVKNQPQRRQPFESVFENPLLEGTRYEYKPKDVFQAPRTQAQKKPAPVQQAPQKPQVSPALERAITSIDLAAKSMPEGTIKSGLEAVQSSLELAKQAQSKGDSAAYTRAITDLSSKTFKLVGDLVKQLGQNPELAGKAAEQLGAIAKVLGKGAGALKVLDNASKLLSGKTLGGTPVDANARAEAAYDLVSGAMPAPIQAAMAITKVELEALYNHLGVPVKRATEEYGLKRLFGGKSPEQMKAAIEKLSTDAPNANATVRQLLGIFPNSTSGMSQATASSLWRTYMAEAMKGDADALKAMVNQDPKKPTGVPDMLREVVAERMKAAALRFVDQQVRDARGSW